MDESTMSTSTLDHELDSRWFYKESVDSLFDSPRGCRDFLPNVWKQVNSSEFLWFVESSGILRPSVEINPHVAESALYRRFVLRGGNRISELSVGKIADNEDVRIVFHGTPEQNVDSILRNGLDPTLRRGQKFGQGEYFAGNPAMSLGYCRGGNRMLVFAVVATPAEVRARDVIVVEDGARQLPIATLSFEGHGASALSVAAAFEARVQELLGEARNAEARAEEARSKEKIIRLVLEGEYLAASDIYKKACGADGVPPSRPWAQEVAAYVRDHVRDDEMADLYFPNLPPRPPVLNEMDILNTKRCEQEAWEAKQKYEALSQQNSAISSVWFHEESVDSVSRSSGRGERWLQNMLRRVDSREFLQFVELSDIAQPSVEINPQLSAIVQPSAETNPQIAETDMSQQFLQEVLNCSSREYSESLIVENTTGSNEAKASSSYKGIGAGSTKEGTVFATIGESANFNEGGSEGAMVGSKLESKELSKGDGHYVRIVFYGMHEADLDNILHNGLDHVLQKDQNCGQGEYFASNPAMAAGFCQGDRNRLLVFVVITTKADMLGGDIVTVKDSARRLPIAVLSFTGYGNSALLLASAFTTEVDNARKKAEEIERLKQEARSQEKIIRLILAGDYLAASDIYKKACGANDAMPPTSWAEEIAPYVRGHIRDNDMVDVYFPNLSPLPP